MSGVRNQKLRVAIIGGGPAGLVAAKSMRECGLEPVILEKTDGIGGLWRPGTGATWSNMRTNLSKFTCMFSDFPWPANTDLFPTQAAMYDYLKRYAKHFNIDNNIHLNAKVNGVKRNDDNSWQIAWREGNELKNEKFDFVTIASGIFSKPYIPPFKGLDLFAQKKSVLHSSQFKSAQDFKDKKVVIVGGAFSGAEIASDIGTVAKEVVNVINRPFWVLPRFLSIDVNNKQSNASYPLDLIMNRRTPKIIPPIEVGSTFTINKYFYYLKGNSDQHEFDNALTMNTQSNDPPRVIVSDNYLNEVKSQQIKIQCNQIKEFDENGIIFADGTRIEPDAVIFSTGYKLDLGYLDKQTLDQLGFSPDDQLQPLLLYKCTMHPDVPNLTFAGVYRGPYFAVMELQARWAAMLFSGELDMPNHEVMMKGLQDELKIRLQKPRPQFPHGNYIEFADSLAKEIHALPENLYDIKEENPHVYRLLNEGPVIPSHFRFFGPHNNFAVAVEQSEAAYKQSESDYPETKNKDMQL